jgi:hypothetical protein
VAILTATMILAWSLGVPLHWWPRLATPVRHRLGVIASLGGLAFLIAALRAEGSRESAMTSAVLLGANFRTEVESAQASYSYYVLAAACWLLGLAAVAFGEPLARWLSARPVLSSAAVAWLITLVRFLLEKSAAPAILAQAMGVTWMIPIAGAYLAVTLPAAPAGEGGWRPLARRLVAYAFLVRGAVALTGLLATRLGLGTHYDVSDLTRLALGAGGRVYSLAPASWPQLLWLTLLPQLVAWPALTILVGLLGGAATLRFLSWRHARRRTQAPTVASAPQGDS